MKTAREESPNRTDLEELVKCSRCKNKHKLGDRLWKRNDPKYLMYDEVCPRCECKSYVILSTPILTP